MPAAVLVHTAQKVLADDSAVETLSWGLLVVPGGADGRFASGCGMAQGYITTSGLELGMVPLLSGAA